MATHASASSAGDVLRRARIQRSISMDRASWDTRISAEYLHALEDGVPLQAFPEPVYAKFFLRPHYQLEGVDVGLSLVSRMPGGA